MIRPFSLFASGALLALLACQSPGASDRRLQRYQAAMARGMALFQQAQYSQADAEFQAALRHTPGAPEALNMRGMTQMRMKQKTTALACFQEAVTVDPTFAPAWCNLGAWHVRDQRPDLAQVALRRAVAVRPDLPQAHFSLGNLLMMTGQEAEARQHLLRAFELDPSLQSTTHGAALHSPEAIPLSACLALARICASTGRTGEALHFLQLAKRQGFRDWQPLLDEKDFQPLLGHPALTTLSR